MTQHIKSTVPRRKGKGSPDISNRRLRAFLVKKRACPEALKWLGKRSLVEAWSACNSYAWMYWLLDKILRTDSRLPNYLCLYWGRDARSRALRREFPTKKVVELFPK